MRDIEDVVADPEAEEVYELYLEALERDEDIPTTDEF